MTFSEHQNIEHAYYYSKGWNACASAWASNTAKLTEPQTLLVGSKRESWLEGWRDCQDEMLLNFNNKLKP